MFDYVQCEAHYLLGIVRTSLTKSFLAEPTIRSVSFRYGFLAFNVALLVFGAWNCMYLSKSYRGGRYFGIIVPLMLLLNHLAYQFRWSRAVMIALRVIAWTWILFAMPYMIFVALAR